MTQEDISVVIVTYNNEDTIKQCLNSILSSLDVAEVIVLDNNSSDCTKKVLKTFQQKKVRYIFMPNNSGFAKGCNIGAVTAISKYICFVNPDAYFATPTGLRDLKNSLQENSQFGLVGPKLLFANGETQKSVRNLPTVTRAVREYLFKQRGSYEFFIPEGDGLIKVESVVGACMMIQKELFLRMGKFNEKYFMYFEDLDLCKKILKNGLSIGYLSTVEVRHFHGVSGKGANAQKLSHQSAQLYFGWMQLMVINLIGRLGNKLSKYL